MSGQSLPVVGYPHGYPNEGQEEVYAYEAEGGGSLFCVSCSRSGEAPRYRVNSAGVLPVSWMKTEQPQVISDDGSRVFFDSWEPLVSQDTNGSSMCMSGSVMVRVAAAKAGGVSTCSQVALARLRRGSWGRARAGDAFVISRADLTGTAGYEGFAVYDARVGGVQPVALPVCTGSGCQGVPPAAPIFATPASVSSLALGTSQHRATVAPTEESQTEVESQVEVKGACARGGWRVRCGRVGGGVGERGRCVWREHGGVTERDRVLVGRRCEGGGGSQRIQKLVLLLGGVCGGGVGVAGGCVGVAGVGAFTRVSPAYLPPGGTGRIEVRVYNTGSSTGEDPRIVDELPAGVSATSASVSLRAGVAEEVAFGGGDGECSGVQVVTCTAETVPAGASAIVIIEVSVDAGVSSRRLTVSRLLGVVR